MPRKSKSLAEGNVKVKMLGRADLATTTKGPGSTQRDSGMETALFNDAGIVEPEIDFGLLIDLYSENVTLQRCIDVTARAVFKQGYLIKPDEKDAKVPESIHDFFERGNPNKPFEEEGVAVVTDLLNTGSASMEIVRFLNKPDGIPVGFYRAPIAKIRVAKGRTKDDGVGAFKTGQRFVEVDNNIFGSDAKVIWYNAYTPRKEDRDDAKGYARRPPKGTKQKVINEIMWFTLSNPKSKYYGQSPAVSLSRILLMAKYTEEFNIDQFEHGWLHKFIFVIKRGTISDENMLELETYVDEILREEKKWSRVPIIELQGEDKADFDVKFLNQHPPEGAYLNLMKYLREMVFMGYGVPPIILNLVENANRSNSQDQRMTFYSDQVRPLQMLLAYRFTKMIREDFGFPATFKFNSPDLTNAVDDAEVVKEMVARGIITPNQGREILGMDKVMGVPMMDEYMVYLPNGLIALSGFKTVDAFNSEMKDQMGGNKAKEEGAAPPEKKKPSKKKSEDSEDNMLENSEENGEDEK